MAATGTPLLTPIEVAQRLGVSKPTVYRLIGDGDLPALRIGGQIRVDPAELRDYI
jgi:excisionase family DNA binding protein